VVTSVEDIRRIAGEVPDPELPALTIEDLGILREVRVDAAGGIVVDITPTYSGCPALEVIRDDVERSIREQGYRDVTVQVVLSPAWTTDWMTDEGRRKLLEYGIAPPRARGDDLQLLQLAVACPTCGLAHTSEVAHFGATQCQAVRTCAGCRETFPHFKEH
jgi:ring-1,2-phenylacetyl-CoA epoxidase subunit PaaD